MKNIIIGTAGHIDHGKTTLIRALTREEELRLILGLPILTCLRETGLEL